MTAIHYQRHPEQRALARVSKDAGMHCRQAMLAIMATLSLAACDREAPIDPVDEARAVLQARWPDTDISLVVVEEGGGHRVVCGTRLPSTWPVLEFLVVDGRLVDSEYAGPASALVAACIDKVPKGPPMPPAIS